MFDRQLLIKHDSMHDYKLRIKIIYDLKEKFKRNCIYRKKALQAISGINPERMYYDYFVVIAINNKYLNIPFRKDIANIETIQYPDITEIYGGDCDDLVLFFSILFECVGVITKYIISKQNHNYFDHIAIYLPSMKCVFDKTRNPSFPLTITDYKDFEIYG